MNENEIDYAYQAGSGNCQVADKPELVVRRPNCYAIATFKSKVQKRTCQSVDLEMKCYQSGKFFFNDNLRFLLLLSPVILQKLFDFLQDMKSMKFVQESCLLFLQKLVQYSSISKALCQFYADNWAQNERLMRMLDDWEEEKMKEYDNLDTRRILFSERSFDGTKFVWRVWIQLIDNTIVFCVQTHNWAVFESLTSKVYALHFSELTKQTSTKLTFYLIFFLKELDDFVIHQIDYNIESSNLKWRYKIIL